MNIRPADVYDADIFYALGCRMAAESVTSFPAVERDKIVRSLELCQQFPTLFWAAVALNGNEAVGVVNAAAGDYVFSTEKRGLVDILYVVPEHRGSSAALRLMQAYRHWAKSNGVKRHWAGNTTGLEPERFRKFMLHMGFEPVGEMFIAETA